MKLITTPTTETFIEKGGVTVSIANWGNLDGCTVTVHEKSTQLLCTSMTWEQLDMLIAALCAARA